MNKSQERRVQKLGSCLVSKMSSTTRKILKKIGHRKEEILAYEKSNRHKKLQLKEDERRKLVFIKRQEKKFWDKYDKSMRRFCL